MKSDYPSLSSNFERKAEIKMASLHPVLAWEKCIPYLMNLFPVAPASLLSAVCSGIFSLMFHVCQMCT